MNTQSVTIELEEVEWAVTGYATGLDDLAYLIESGDYADPTTGTVGRLYRAVRVSTLPATVRPANLWHAGGLDTSTQPVRGPIRRSYVEALGDARCMGRIDEVGGQYPWAAMYGCTESAK